MSPRREEDTEEVEVEEEEDPPLSSSSQGKKPPPPPREAAVAVRTAPPPAAAAAAGGTAHRKRPEATAPPTTAATTMTTKKKKKIKLFADSGLTDAARREIRQSQRALQQTLRDGGECATSTGLAEARATNNAIFHDRVVFTREGALFILFFRVWWLLAC